MPFEKIGELFFSKMRPPFFFILVLCPCILASIFACIKQMEIQELEERFLRASRFEKSANEKMGRKKEFLAKFSKANPYFLDQQIESLVFLEQEKEKITSLLEHPAFPKSELIRERLKTIDANRLGFVEGQIKTAQNMREVEEKQKEPIEMDEEDLQKLLSLLENVQVSAYLPPKESPQIIIKDLRIKKQESLFQTEHFVVEMELLKREFQ